MCVRVCVGLTQIAVINKGYHLVKYELHQGLCGAFHHNIATTSPHIQFWDRESFCLNVPC